MDNKYFVTSQQPSSQLFLVGGKAYNLQKLEKMAVSVPKWFCITTNMLNQIVERHQFQQHYVKLVPEKQAIEKFSEIIVNEIKHKAQSFLAQSKVFEFFEQLDSTYVSVRSSASSEDSDNASYAGLLDSFLFVTKDNLIDNIINCFISAYSPQVLYYELLNNSDKPEKRQLPSVAVIVQTMIKGKVSGVAFTADPIKNNLNHCIITAGLGVGEGIVQDHVETDQYIYNWSQASFIESKISTKTKQVSFNHKKNTGTFLEELVTPNTEPLLNNNDLEKLISVLNTIKTKSGSPQDIEWAINPSGELYILQTRPITTINTNISDSIRAVYDNTNLVESYPGITLPLTFSFARVCYETIFKKALDTFGLPKWRVKQGDHLYPNLLGYINGRMYYNIGNWYQIYALAYAPKEQTQAWEKALGLKESLLQDTDCDQQYKNIYAKLLVFRGIIWNFFRIRKRVNQLFKAFEVSRQLVDRKFSNTMDEVDCVNLFNQLKGSLIPHWDISIINDFYLFQFHAILNKLIKKWNLDRTDQLINDLLGNESDIDSLKPLKSLFELLEVIQTTSSLKALFNSSISNQAVLDQLNETIEFKDFLDKLNNHIVQFKDRTLQELKLETKSLDDDPTLVIASLRNYLSSNINYSNFKYKVSSARTLAENIINSKLATKPIKLLLFNFILKQCRRSLKYRENMRLTRTKAFGLVKKIFRHIANIWITKGILDNADDIFYLTIEEVCNYVQGNSTHQNLKSLINLRKDDINDYQQLTMPNRITCHDTLYENIKQFQNISHAKNDQVNQLSGQGCSPGIVKEQALIIDNPDLSIKINNEILVTKMTDPGWIFLMASASGLIVEQGSVLSHTAIVGRELGIPTIVGVDNAMQIIKNQQMVTMNGVTGNIELM